MFRKNVADFFLEHPDLNRSPPIIHSVKSRMKDPEHLREKIMRKSTLEDPITPDNVFDRITDLAGVRVLHLYQAQFSEIHEAITEQLTNQDWVLYEPPTAYTWDPESRDFFASHEGVQVQVKDSFYTSVHYIVKPRTDSPLCCEIQVRTLFEEIWGEVAHMLNYPNPTESVSCKEQIRVLARLVGAGSRLTDSIFRTHSEYAGMDTH
jgi:ppGpp synthetase/RelA/SpoT-type nucleotidyltranferase